MSTSQFTCLLESELLVIILIDSFKNQIKIPDILVVNSQWIPKPLIFFISIGFLGNSADKESACDAGDPGSIPGLGESAGERIGYPLQYSWASLVTELLKNLPAMQETWVRSLSWEDPLEKGTATHSSYPLWPGEFHGLYSPWGCKESDTTEQYSLVHFSHIDMNDRFGALF